MLSTPWSRSFGLRVPILNAPMGGVAGGRLAAAVTAAGGLGMVGMGSDGSRELLRTELRHARGRFGIGLVDWVMRGEAGLLEDALAARPALLSVSFGTDWSWIGKAHDAGIATVTQVYDGLGARRAADAGIDILVARGSEGGGHGEARLGTLPLLDDVLAAVDDAAVPVLAGGGIASPRSLAAVLAAGASGAWVGTRLAACPEALTGDGGRRALVAARATDTAVTRVFDVAKGLAGAVPVARVGQRLRRALGGQRGRTRSLGPRRTGDGDRRRRPPDRARGRRPGRRDDRRRRAGGRGHRADVCGRRAVAGRLGVLRALSRGVTPRAGSAWR